MTTRTKTYPANLTLATVRSEIRRMEGEVRHPDADSLVVSEQIVKLSLLRDELAIRMMA